VLVDIRPGSPSFGHWEGSSSTMRTTEQLYVPGGFAHGFCVVLEPADVSYKCSASYDPAAESGFRFDDPEVGIRWPEGIEFQTSERDREAPLLSELTLEG
jgi:dTDP-4-dehydrorhamnose 3,5-epimerase